MRRVSGAGGFPAHPTHSSPPRPAARLICSGAAVSSLRYFTALRRFLPPVPFCLGFRMRPPIL